MEEVPLGQELVEEGNLIVHSDRQVRTGMKRMRTMIRRLTRTMKEKMMRMKSTIVKIIEDDIYIIILYKPLTKLIVIMI